MSYYDRQGNEINSKEWGLLHGDNDYRIVDCVALDDVMVSTVWLGIDHSFSDDGPPIIFETMVFGGKYDQEQWRYSTEEQAMAGHEEVVKLVFPYGPPVIPDGWNTFA